ncbi:hypothetical protein [Streptomyces sp. KL110A]|uniref:hypothetical protein n=1 Tax=Streptomyces sp. KL110A TaxID=3384221 RepID=UPI0038BF08D0
MRTGTVGRSRPPESVPGSSPGCWVSVDSEPGSRGGASGQTGAAIGMVGRSWPPGGSTVADRS